MLGEVVGAFSFSVGHGANILKKVASVRMAHQAHENQNIMSYPLKRKVRFSFLLCGNAILIFTFCIFHAFTHLHVLEFCFLMSL